MDYTKVISFVKKCTLALLDEIDTLSRNIETALEALFTNTKKETDAIKTDVATVKTDVGGVKTDVAGVGSKVDAGVTTLGSKVDGVKSDIAKTAKSTEVSNLGNKLTGEIKKSYLDLTKAQYKELNSKFHTNTDVISVDGSGEIYLIAIDSMQYAVQVKVEVDGATECFIVSTNKDAGFIYEGIVRGSSNATWFIHSFGYCYTYDTILYNYDLYKIKNKVTDYYGSNTKFLIKKEPLKFNKSFKITVVEPFGESNESFDCKIAYSLN